MTYFKGSKRKNENRQKKDGQTGENRHGCPLDPEGHAVHHRPAQRLCTNVSFYDGFRFSLNKFLARFSEHKTEARLLPHQAAQDRNFGLGLLQPTQQLTARPYSQAANTFPWQHYPLCDAAGASFAKGDGHFMQSGTKMTVMRAPSLPWRMDQCGFAPESCGPPS